MDDVEAEEMAEALVDAIELLREVVSACSDDWRRHPCNAIMRAVLLGFDDYDPDAGRVVAIDRLTSELKRRHGWTDAKIDHLRHLHNAVARLTGDPSLPAKSSPRTWLTRSRA